MRILHTADWHLGRTFHGASLLDAQASWTAWLADLAADSAVDAIVVSGDLYDRALPPVDAVRLADEALARLVEIAPVIVTPGNHDSAARLSFGSALMERAGLFVRTRVDQIGEPVLVDGLAVYPIPYLEPDVARGQLGVEERGHGPVLAAAMDCVRDDIALRSGLKTVVLAHAFVAGAQTTDSERDLSVGGAASVAPGVFNGVDYVALGHVHRPQKVGSIGRYCGSPIAFSFGEAAHVKSVPIVDLSGDRFAVELVECPVPRPLASLRGELEDLLSADEHAAAEDAWVEVTLTDRMRPLDAMERLRARFGWIVALHFDPVGGGDAFAGTYAERVRGLSDRELVAAFVEDVRGAGPDAAEQALLDEALEAHRVLAAHKDAA